MTLSKSAYSIWRRLSLAAITLILLAGSSCNKDDDKAEIDYIAAQSVAVTKFSIKPKAQVMANLDSVYFSIDLKNHVIFNADSLPMGTRVTGLVPLITYPSTVDKAIIEMTGGTDRTGTVDYTKSPSDTIDFSGDVRLTLSTADGTLSQTYTLKVNVHKCQPDSLMWDNVSISPLPSRYANPKQQKTVESGISVVSLIQEYNDEYTLAATDSPADADWRTGRLTLPFAPNIRTLTAVNSDLYILSSTGDLMKSSDKGITWSSQGVRWSNIIGAYENSLLGIASDKFDIFPRPTGFAPYTLPTGFPTDKISNFTTISTKWAESPIGFFTGGRCNGSTQNSTWAFDGSSWGNITNNPLPALNDALIVPYFCYRKTNASWIQTEYTVHLCMGGTLADGSINDVLYISFDNGVNWKTADQQMQYPNFIRPGYGADAIIRTTPMTADLNAHWKDDSATSGQPLSKHRRIQYFVDGDKVEWECPYIYLFGGMDAAGTLNDEIRRAVLARLTFAPIF